MSSYSARRPSWVTNSPQHAVALPTARHAASIVSLPSIATALLSRPWGVSAALSLPLARTPAARFATAILSTPSRAPRRRRPALFFALRWIPAAAAAPSPRTKPSRTAFTRERARAKASDLLRSLPRMPAPALVAQRTSPLRSLPSKASVRSCAARRTNLSRKPLYRTSVPTLAAQRRTL